MKITAILVLVVAGLAPMPGAWAHRYIENDGTHTTAERAIPRGDIGLSQVVYHEVTAASGSVCWAKVMILTRLPRWLRSSLASVRSMSGPVTRRSAT